MTKLTKPRKSSAGKPCCDAANIARLLGQVTGCIIMPHGQKRLIWDSIGMMLILWLALYIPYPIHWN